MNGQHRVAGITAAISKNPALAIEQVQVIFITHSNDDRGMKKTRKLFSTLNRRAKPVGQNENIALDEDDISSIITRDVVQEFPLCMGTNIINSLGKQIQNSNEEAFTSLITLYQCVELLIKHKLGETGIKGKRYSDYKLYRPKDDEISFLKEYVFNVFEAFAEHTDVIREYMSLTGATKAQRFRSSAGGNLLFIPIAITKYFEAAYFLCQRGGASTYAEVFRLLNSVELDIAKQPWLGLVWDGTKIINRASKTVIRALLLYMANTDMLSQREQEKLIRDYASSVNSSQKEAANYLAAVKRERS